MASSPAVGRESRIDSKTVSASPIGYDHNANAVSVANIYLRPLVGCNGFPAGRSRKVGVEIFPGRSPIDDPVHFVRISRDRCINELVRGFERCEGALAHIADRI